MVNAGLRNWVFVKVETDQPGLVGWGEATLEWKTRAVVGAVEDLASLVLGEDPRRTEYLWEVLDRQQFFDGGIVTHSAASGIDQALWDIRGKDAGLSVAQLLGGPVRDRVRMYDHLGGGDPNAVYDEATVDGFRARATDSMAAGFDALKILAVPRTRPLEGSASVRSAASLLRTVREVVGTDVDIMVDLHGRTGAAMAIEYARAFVDYQPWFIEEPCRPGNTAELALVARSTSIPVATGERLTTRHQFRDVLEARAAAVLQPDVCHAGGFTGLRRIAALAAAFDISLAPHNPLGPVATMASIQFAFACQNHLIQEVMRSDVPWRDEVVDAPLVIERGWVRLPERAGIGVVVDESAARRHPYQPEPSMRWFHADGTVADW